MGGRTAVVAVFVVWAALLAGPPDARACAAWLALACAALALVHRAPPRTGAALALLALAATALARGGASRLAWDARRAALPPDGAIVRVRAVTDEPARRESGDAVVRARVVAASPPLAAGTRLRLRFSGSPPLVPGDALDALVRIDRFPGARNPGGSSLLGAARTADVVASARVFASHPVPPGTPRRWLRAADPRRAAAHARTAIEDAVATLSPGARELVLPLLTGDRSGLRPESEADLRGAGLVHLLALSGLHVGWFAAVVRGLAVLLAATSSLRALSGPAAALGYLAVAGPFPSLLRAVASECWGAASALAGRALDPLQGLALSALVVLCLAPACATDLGFQLSCAATGGLVVLAPVLGRRVPAAGPARLVLAPLALTLAAQVPTLPLLAARFHALPWAGLLANLAAVPLAEGLLTGSVLLVAAESVAPGSGAPWASACELLAAGLARVAAGAARFPGALLAIGPEPGIGILFALGAAAWLAAALPPRAVHRAARSGGGMRERLAGTGGVLFATGLLAALTSAPLRPPAGRVWLVALDVGQGDALWVATPRSAWLVDAGPRQPRFDAGERMVLPFLRWAGVRRLDGLLLTHDDGDHTGGAPAVMRSARARVAGVPVAQPHVPGPAHRVPHPHRLARGDTLDLGGARLRVLWPPRPVEPDAAVADRENNAASLVVEIAAGDDRVLLSGDADSLVEARLGVAPDVAVFKLGHHGSASSNGAAFLAALRPRWTVVSAGRRNTYGHPAPRVLECAVAVGARLARTDHEGAVWFELGGGVRRVDWRRGVGCGAASPVHGVRAPER